MAVLEIACIDSNMRAEGTLVESGFLVERVPQGDLVRVFVADPSQGRSSGGLSTQRPSLALMVTALVGSDGSIGPPTVEMAVVKVKRHLLHLEVGLVLGRPQDSEFPLLQAAQDLALRLWTLRTAGADPARRPPSLNDRSAMAIGGIIENEISLLGNYLFTLFAMQRGLPFHYLHVPAGFTGLRREEVDSRFSRYEGNGYPSYARVTRAIRQRDARGNATVLIEYLIDRAARGLRDPASSVPEWISDFQKAAEETAGASTALLSRYVEVAELLGPPERWLVAAVDEFFADQSKDHPVALLQSLFTNVRTASREWAQVREAGIATCVKQPGLADMIMDHGLSVGRDSEASAPITAGGPPMHSTGRC